MKHCIILKPCTGGSVALFGVPTYKKMSLVGDGQLGLGRREWVLGNKGGGGDSSLPTYLVILLPQPSLQRPCPLPVLNLL